MESFLRRRKGFEIFCGFCFHLHHKLGLWPKIKGVVVFLLKDGVKYMCSRACVCRAASCLCSDLVSDDVYMYLNFTSSERGPSQRVDGPCCAMLFANLQINMHDRPKKWGHRLMTHDHNAVKS